MWYGVYVGGGCMREKRGIGNGNRGGMYDGFSGKERGGHKG
jgi:hypothetical protein